MLSIQTTKEPNRFSKYHFDMFYNYDVMQNVVRSLFEIQRQMILALS